MIKVEPCISTFDRMQSQPLKAIMTVTTKLVPNLQWKHSWKHLTIQNNENWEYIAWLAYLAYDHLDGWAKIYVNNKLFSARIFEDEFHTACGNMVSRQVVGNNGKRKGTGAEGVRTSADLEKGCRSHTRGQRFIHESGNMDPQNQSAICV